jgi:hypothetical protein
MRRRRGGVKGRGAFALTALCLLAACGGAASATTGARVVQVSHCPGQNAEVEQAVDGRYVYEVWIGCGHRIGFARSVDGGRTFGRSKALPESFLAGRPHAWDPAVAVAPNGTVYVSFMVHAVVAAGKGTAHELTPVVAVSQNRGKSFARVTHLPIPTPTTPRGNFGDRDFIAVGPDGTVYVTWDYAPRADTVRIRCLPSASCVFAGGDFNAVIQKSSDGGRTWTKLTPVSPGFPLGGVYSAPVVAERDGTLDVLLWQHPTNPTTLAVSPGRELFTRSTDGGTTWSHPVAVGPQAGTIPLETWWIDGALAVDPAGNLYASWDTARGSRDTGWLAWSKNGGSRWSTPVRVASSRSLHLMEVAPAGRGRAYVAWQTPVRGKGYATFLRPFSLGQGWTGPARMVSKRYGHRGIWPGDTFGLSQRGASALLSWGSATGRSTHSQIYSSAMQVPR